MTDLAFWEVGASGRVHDRDVVLDTLEARRTDPQPDPWKVDDFAVRSLGGNAWLATYRLDQGGRITRRATVWLHDRDGWRVAYHQGTLVHEPERGAVSGRWSTDSIRRGGG